MQIGLFSKLLPVPPPGQAQCRERQMQPSDGKEPAIGLNGRSSNWDVTPDGPEDCHRFPQQSLRVASYTGLTDSTIKSHDLVPHDSPMALKTPQ